MKKYNKNQAIIMNDNSLIEIHHRGAIIDLIQKMVRDQLIMTQLKL